MVGTGAGVGAVTGDVGAVVISGTHLFEVSRCWPCLHICAETRARIESADI